MDWLQAILSGQIQRLYLGHVVLQIDALTIYGLLPIIFQLPALLAAMAASGKKNKTAWVDWLIPTLLWPVIIVIFIRYNLNQITKGGLATHEPWLQYASLVILIALLVNLTVILLRWPADVWRWQVLLVLPLVLNALAANVNVLRLMLWNNLAASLLVWLLAPPLKKATAVYTAIMAYFWGLVAALLILDDLFAALAELAMLTMANGMMLVITPPLQLLVKSLQTIPHLVWLGLAWSGALLASLAVGSDIRKHWQTQRLSLPEHLLWRLKPHLQQPANYRRRLAIQALLLLLALWLVFKQT